MNIYSSYLLNTNLIPFLPEIFLATGILIFVIHASLIVSSKINGYSLVTRSFNKLSILILILVLLLITNRENDINITYQSTFIFDYLASNIKEILIISSIFCLSISEDSVLTNRINNFEYFALLLCGILGLMFLISSYDLLSFYLAIEMQSLCFYVLAASKKESSFSIEAGLKYFILGSVSSIFLLLGISIIYGSSGTTSFEHLNLLFSAELPEQKDSAFLINNAINNALICISIAFFFKVGAAPFHMWAPDVYEGAPTSISVFFAIVPKLVLFGSFLRIFQGTLSGFSTLFVYLFTFCCIFSVMIGSFIALKQKKIKRLLAYSSIGHVGYLLLAFSSNSIEGTQFLFFYIFIYMITSFGLWSLVLSLNSLSNSEKSKTLLDLGSLSTKNPLLGFSTMLALFSLAGIPPLSGFFAKIEIFINALNASLFLAALFAILSSVVSAFYYIRLVKIIYFEKSQLYFSSQDINYSCSILLAMCTFFLLFFFINPCFLLLVAQKLALSLYII